MGFNYLLLYTYLFFIIWTKGLTSKRLEMKKILWWRNQADLDQIIQEIENLIIKDLVEINKVQTVQWK